MPFSESLSHALARAWPGNPSHGWYLPGEQTECKFNILMKQMSGICFIWIKHLWHKPQWKTNSKKVVNQNSAFRALKCVCEKLCWRASSIYTKSFGNALSAGENGCNVHICTRSDSEWCTSVTVSTPKEIPGSQEILLHGSADLSEDRCSGFETLVFPQSAI